MGKFSLGNIPLGNAFGKVPDIALYTIIFKHKFICVILSNLKNYSFTFCKFTILEFTKDNKRIFARLYLSFFVEERNCRQTWDHVIYSRRSTYRDLNRHYQFYSYNRRTRTKNQTTRQRIREILEINSIQHQNVASWSSGLPQKCRFEGFSEKYRYQGFSSRNSQIFI